MATKARVCSAAGHILEGGVAGATTLGASLNEYHRIKQQEGSRLHDNTTPSLAGSHPESTFPAMGSS
jgi:hypothetical protein